jgi:hypothetical protein
MQLFFTSLLLDVHMWLNIIWVSPLPSSGAHNCTRSLWLYLLPQNYCSQTGMILINLRRKCRVWLRTTNVSTRSSPNSFGSYFVPYFLTVICHSDGSQGLDAEEKENKSLAPTGNWTALFCCQARSTVTTTYSAIRLFYNFGRGHLKCNGARAETRFRLSAKRTSQFKSAGASVQSSTGSRGVRISGSSAGYNTFRGSVKSTGYLLHSPVSPSLPLPCVTVCHHISTGVYTIL